MALPPAIEKGIEKTDAFLAKYPNLTQYGAYTCFSVVLLRSLRPRPCDGFLVVSYYALGRMRIVGSDTFGR